MPGGARSVRFAALGTGDVSLPGAAFAEREGSYVNHADWLQSFSWAVRPPAGVRVEAGVYWELLDRVGPVEGATRDGRSGAEIRYFCAPAADPVGPT